jgi:hypothetical protein
VRTKALIQSAAPRGGSARRLTEEALESADNWLAPGILEAATAENYQLDTAMWIGATLDQGVWYQISAPLSLAGIPRIVIQHRIQFAFTRMLPCTAARVSASCVEIVFQATPDPQALRQVLAKLSAQFDFAESAHYTASREARIVMDPTTLLPYEREERSSWYIVTGNGRKNKELQSTHFVATAIYQPR